MALLDMFEEPAEGEVTMKRTVLREHTNEHGTREFCQLEVELDDRGDGQELSICGTSGIVVTVAEAKSQALDYWASYFEDQPEEQKAMAKRFGKRLHDARAAARFVVATDGPYHGLDVLHEEGDKVYIIERFIEISKRHTEENT